MRRTICENFEGSPTCKGTCDSTTPESEGWLCVYHRGKHIDICSVDCAFPVLRTLGKLEAERR